MGVRATHMRKSLYAGLDGARVGWEGRGARGKRGSQGRHMPVPSTKSGGFRTRTLMGPLQRSSYQVGGESVVL